MPGVVSVAKEAEDQSLLRELHRTLELDRLANAVAALGPVVAQHRVCIAAHHPRQGEILDAMRMVLVGHPRGLRMTEVHRLVEQRLGRPVSRSTIEATLPDNPAFGRVSRGIYRLRGSNSSGCSGVIRLSGVAVARADLSRPAR